MSDPSAATHGRLRDNIAHFARGLRRAGLAVAPGRVADAIAAVQAIGVTSREDLYWALHACFVSRPEHRAVFAAAFKLFWRDPLTLERQPPPPGTAAGAAAGGDRHDPDAAARRARQALSDGVETPPRLQHPEDVDLDARWTLSAEERLRARDFEQMSAEESTAAAAAIARLTFPAPLLLSRRLAPDPRGRVPDWRATARQSFRTGGRPLRLARRARRRRWPTLVALCDISGSMSGYSRMLLHFLHGISNRPGDGWAAVESFVFGTRLTPITRHLQRRDVDDALARAGREVLDWRGGTRIGACLDEFNRVWARRVLGEGAVVLLITDGLERDDPERLAAAARRLRRSCRRLIWLNPLLRWDGFEPKARGVKALLPTVDLFHAAHDLNSVAGLAEALSADNSTRF